MKIVSIVVIGMGLAMDSFAVALTTALMAPALSARRIVRAAMLFGAVQFFMLLAGWLVGTPVRNVLAGYEHWAACVLLVAVGAKMISDFLRSHNRANEKLFEGSRLLILSFATSMDALAVGMGLAMLKFHPFSAGVLIGLTAFAMTMIGFTTGKGFGRVGAKWMSAIGGLALIAIGIRVLLFHVP